jgi:DsbC/DsbD-like thiol-disulfide interchange protein
MRIFWIGLFLLTGMAVAQAGGKPELLADGNRAGLRIMLEPGWKTYWRLPGETGVAPRFDWSGSQNLKTAEVLYPAPTRFRDPDGETIGFADEVVFPFRIEPLDASKPVILRLRLDYAVCQQICIPASAELAADLGRADAAAAAQLDAAMAGLPRKLAGDAASLTLAPEGLRLALRLPDGGVPGDVFVEGAPLFYFRAPKAEGSKDLILPVDDIADLSQLKGASLTLTVTTASSAFEISAKVQ